MFQNQSFPLDSFLIHAPHHALPLKRNSSFSHAINSIASHRIPLTLRNNPESFLKLVSCSLISSSINALIRDPMMSNWLDMCAPDPCRWKQASKPSILNAEENFVDSVSCCEVDFKGGCNVEAS